MLGAAVGGTQAVVLSEETGVEGRTVASVLARYFDRGDLASIDARTVLLVDEASLVSTRDFVALARATEETGAILRLVGDPAQHSAVVAGGIFRYLTEHHPDERPPQPPLSPAGRGDGRGPSRQRRIPGRKDHRGARAVADAMAGSPKPSLPTRPTTFSPAPGMRSGRSASVSRSAGGAR